MTDMEGRIKPGDDVVMAGTVECVDWREILIAVRGSDGITRRYWIDTNDIKSLAPNGRGGRT